MATYTTEIMPYGLRAKGFTWLNFCVTLSLFFSAHNHTHSALICAENSRQINT